MKEFYGNCVDEIIALSTIISDENKQIKEILDKIQEDSRINNLKFDEKVDNLTKKVNNLEVSFDKKMDNLMQMISKMLEKK